jgi:hypothetical protein
LLLINRNSYRNKIQVKIMKASIGNPGDISLAQDVAECLVQELKTAGN